MNPIDTSAFTHFLLFESLGHIEPYQITEPSGFPEIAYSSNQNDERFSRDNSFIASGGKAVRFLDAVGEYTGIQQVVNPQGKIDTFLNMGLDWILESDRQFGFESKIKYILKKNGIEFDAGYLECKAKDTDGYSFFACNIIKDSRVGDYERHEETVIDVFGTRNVRNEEIEPAPVLKFLRRAVPSVFQSKMDMKGNFDQTLPALSSGDEVIFNPISNVVIDGIPSTLGPTQDVNLYQPGTVAEYKEILNNNVLLNATRQLSNIRFKLKIGQLSLTYTDGDFQTQVILAWGNEALDDWTQQILYSSTSDSVSLSGQTFEFTIPNVGAGQKVWFYFRSRCTSSNILTKARIELSVSTIEMSSKVTVLNTVISGVRYIDMFRQCSKFIRNIPINAPRWDVGGEFYDQVCWGRGCVSQNTSMPFVTKYGECLGSVNEVCGDYENKIDEIFVGTFPDFYKNVEIGVFNIRPSSASMKKWNEKFLINNVKLGFSTFQEDSDAGQDTSNDPHTEFEWIVPNEMTANSLERTFEFTRSAYSQQKTVDLEISKPLTSDETDEDVYINDIVPIPAGSFDEFGAVLSVQLTIISGLLMVIIRNKKSDGDDNDVFINWTVLGIQVGDTFYITDGANTGTYNVYSLTRSLIILSPVGFAPSQAGDLYVKLKYFHTDVDFQTQTNEGFDLIEGISIPDEYPNLQRTLRRAFQHWGSIINTACSYVRDKIIQPTPTLKVNGSLVTQYLGGPVYLEEEDILVSDLPARILTPDLHEINCFCTYEEAVQFLENYKSNRGFIRAFDVSDRLIKGFVQNFEFHIAKETMSMTLEEKFEEKILDLVYEDGILNVFGTPYDLNGITDWWKVENEYFRAFDANYKALCNWKQYDEVSLNGIVHESVDDLIIALNDLA